VHSLRNSRTTRPPSRPHSTASATGSGNGFAIDSFSPSRPWRRALPEPRRRQSTSRTNRRFPA
jgi:hypothetical protein